MPAPAATSPTAPPLPPEGRIRSGRSFPTLRTIGALVLREMATRFGRKPGGYLWAFIQPLMLIVILGVAFSLIARTPSLGTSFILFKATGMLVFNMAKQTSQVVGRSLSYSRTLLEYPGVVWIDAVLARYLLNSLVSLIVMPVLLVGIIVVEDVTLILDWGAITLSVVLALLTALSWGMLNAYLFERFDVWSNIWQILTAPLMIVSGVILLYEDLPAFAQDVLWYNPLLHVTGLMRAGFYSTYQPQYISVTFVVTCAMVPLVLGLLLLRRYNREILIR